MESKPQVSVIVPVWNDAARLARCLRAIAGQTYPRDRIQAIVVDNGSNDRSAEVAASFDFVTLLKEAQPGSYAARNRGLAAATGEFVLFTDSDCEPYPDWIERSIAHALAVPRLGIVGGRIELIDDAVSPLSPAALYERLFAFDQAENIAQGLVVTANWLSPRAVLLEHGPFDERLKSGGDKMLARAIAAAGLNLAYAPDAVVKHPVRGSPWSLINKQRRVFGGSWSASSTPRTYRFIDLQYTNLSGALRRSKKVILTSDIGLGSKIMLLALILLLLTTTAIEIIRLWSGGQARRS